MTQRNPMNERYTSDEPRKGVTRKSAASAKPKAKAAASVYIAPTKKPQKKGFLSRMMGGEQESTPQTKAAEKKKEEQRAKAAAYYNPPTAEYRRLRRIWWGLLIVAILFTVLSFFLNSSDKPSPISIVVLVIAYASIIGALLLEFGKIRKVRTRYQREVEFSKTKAAKRERKAIKAAMEADIAEKERKLEEIDTKRQEKKAAMLSFLHRKDNAKDAADAAAGEERANEKADKASSSK